ncbi:hypothetical protein [Actinoplanes sp. NPDC049265]|uniref:hypothetical protein n=1 Tax=Actinoplanes sp. NPDC049265 TaxID=3363902 RepID=UPI003717C3F6
MTDDEESPAKFQRRWDSSDERQLNEDRRRLLLRRPAAASDPAGPGDQPPSTARPPLEDEAGRSDG